MQICHSNSELTVAEEDATLRSQVKIRSSDRPKTVWVSPVGCHIILQIDRIKPYQFTSIYIIYKCINKQKQTNAPNPLNVTHTTRDTNGWCVFAWYIVLKEGLSCTDRGTHPLTSWSPLSSWHSNCRGECELDWSSAGELGSTSSGSRQTAARSSDFVSEARLQITIKQQHKVTFCNKKDSFPSSYC